MADLKGRRVRAAKGFARAEYICPGCEQPVVLHKGLSKRSAHFKHKALLSCSWSEGETLDHLEAKELVHDEFIRRGRRAEMELTFNTLPGDRRADVVVWSPGDKPYAFELQHSPVDPLNLVARIVAYARIGLRQCWIPFLPKGIIDKGQSVSGGIVVQRYIPRPYELWLHKIYGDALWVYEPDQKRFWEARLSPHMLYKEYSVYYGEGGEELSRGGYSEPSKRWKTLRLNGPYCLSDLNVERRYVDAFSKGRMMWPELVIASFRPRVAA